MAQPFHAPYTPLASPHSSFRILTLHPAGHHDLPIETSLQQFELEDHPPYEALSYVWGSPTDTVTVSLDGHPVKITRNLESALRHLRHDEHARALWVDALCIDQSNVHERSLQVKLMGSIYSSCEADLLWIGEEDAQRSRGFDLARRLQRSDVSALRGFLRGFLPARWSDESCYDMMETRDAFEFLPPVEWDALQSVFAKPAVWSRVWVMQELAKAPTVKLVISRQTLDWKDMEGFLDGNFYADRFRDSPSHSLGRTTFYQTFHRTQIIAHQRKITRAVEAAEGAALLLDVLARFRFADASDPRDKIYGLLGLATDVSDIRPDYQKTVQQVCADVFAHHTNTFQNLGLLCQNLWGIPVASRRALTIPSWCPDFISSSPMAPPLLFADRSIFSAGGETLSKPIQISANAELGLKGFDLGELDFVRTPFDSRSHSWLDVRMVLLPQEIGTADRHELLYVHTNEPRVEAFRRTLNADCEAYPTQRLSLSAASDYLKGCDQWYEHIAALREKSGDWQQELEALLQDSRRDPSRREMEAQLTPRMKAVLNSPMLRKMSISWTFATTHLGVYCMVPHEAERGDRIVVLRGGKVPLLVRPQAGLNGLVDQRSSVIGAAYAHGFMDGEALQREEVDIVLV